MSIHPHHPDAAPPAVLADAVAMLRGIAETLWSARSDDELISVVEQAQRLSSVLAAVEAGAVAEADLRGLAKDKLHYGSTGDWLTHTGGLRRGRGEAAGGPGPRPHRTPHPHPARVGGGGGVGDPGRPDPRRRPRPPVRGAGPGPRGAGHARTRGQPGCHRAGQAGPAPGPRGRPRRHRPQARGPAGPGGPGRPRRPVPGDHRGPGRRGPDQGLRQHRGRRPPQGRPPPPHLPDPHHRRRGRLG